MNLIIHHFLKDIRSTHRLLLLWLLALGASVYSVVETAQPSFSASMSTYNNINSGFAVTLSLNAAWVLLISWLIQDEPILGAGSFWRTRPIPGSVSLVSRLGFIVLFAIVPGVLALLYEFSVFQVEAAMQRDMVRAYLMMDLTLGLVVIWLATYTRTFVQFWAAACGTMVLYNMGLPSLLGSLSDFAAMRSASMGPVWLLDAGLVASLLLQYCWQKTRGALAVAILGVVVALMAAALWPFPTDAYDRLAKAGKPAPVKLAYVLNPKASRTNVWYYNTYPPGNTYQSFGVDLLAPLDTMRQAPILADATGSFKMADGTVVPLAQPPGTIRAAIPAAWYTVLSLLNPDFQVIDGWAQNKSQGTGLYYPGNPDKLKGKTGVLTIHLRGNLLTLAKVTELPLAKPTFTHIPNFALWFSLDTWSPQDWRGDLNAIGYARTSTDANLTYITLFVDEKDHLALKGDPNGSGSGPGRTLGDYGTFYFSQTLSYNSQLNRDAKARATVEKTTINDWKVYLYVAKPAGTFVSDVVIPDWKM